MKPLPAVPLTDEDIAAWNDAIYRFWWRPGPRLWGGDRMYQLSIVSDRRDAALMWAARYARYRTFPVDLPPLQLITPVGLIDCGGALWDTDPVWRHRHAT